MKFEEKFQDAKEGFVGPLDGFIPGPIKLKEGGRCVICGTETKWGCIQARKYLCSDECAKNIWHDLFQIFVISQVLS